MSTTLEQLSQETSGIVDQARSFVVCVGAGKAQPRTGFVIAPEEVVTIAMVAEHGESVPVHGPHGEIAATVTGFDQGSGIALLRAPGLVTAAMLSHETPAVGSLGVSVAVPIPDGHEARLEMIRCVGGATRLRGGRRIGSYLQTDAARFRGFGGATLLDIAGRVVGIVMPTHRREESYVVPVAEITAIVDGLRSGTTTGTGYLGVQSTPVELPTPVGEITHGLLLTAVEPDTPASRAGIRVGSFLVAIGETQTPTHEELFDALQGRTDGERVDVTIAAADGTSTVVPVELALRQ